MKLKSLKPWLHDFELILAVITLWLISWCILIPNKCFCQSSCGNPAGPINQNNQAPSCYAINDTSDTLKLCYTFTSPGSTLLFVSVPPANCDSYTATAVLCNNVGDTINSNAFGLVFNLSTGAQYCWCPTYICTGSVGYGNLFCPNYSDFSPLPVTWIYFFGSTHEVAGAVILKWATASEINSSHFDIEWSADGEAFIFIGREPAAGNSTSNNYYQVTDEHPGPMNYYRIKQVDIDGRFTYSTTITVTKIDTTDPVIQIYDVTGRCISREGDITHLQSGVYVVRFNDDRYKLIVK